jgi:diaminopimelate epimerase
MRFSKYQGTGNDFVMLADPDDRLVLSPEMVRALCDRRFGIGGDGVIRVAPGTDGAAFFMDYVNSDGSLGEMCGNGIRCLAVFAREQGLTDEDRLEIMTRAGLKTVEILGDGRVRVDMGAPIFGPQDVPVRWEGHDALQAKIEVAGEMLEAACVSMGNPHAVLFHEDPASAPIRTLGPTIETHEMFPNGTNVEWFRVDGPTHVTMRVWERGSGETLACGTGACAVAVVARAIGGTEERMTVSLAGGDLEVEWKGSLEESAPVHMTGPANKSFEGEIDIDEVMAR